MNKEGQAVPVSVANPQYVEQQGQVAYIPTAVAQPYNGPVAQEAGQPQNSAVEYQHRAQNGPPGPQPQSHCCLAWFSCLFCCWPIGLYAIFEASQVASQYRRNNYSGALRSSELAKKASYMAIIIGLIIIVVTSVTETRYTWNGDDDDSFDNFDSSDNANNVNN